MGEEATNLTYDNVTTSEPVVLQWGVLGLSVLIVAAVLGNVLVCLAVCWEKRLQNMTNYFLMSLAMADLLVSLLVMPLGMVVELYGYFPLHPNLCVLWVAMDVLMCTASIWHMCTMSMDRYFTLKYPMKYGRNKTKTMVVIKITFVWVISIALCSPICIMGFLDYGNVYNNGHCVPTIREFLIYGSIFAFYVPLLIMVITYILTIRILCNNQKLMYQIAKEHKIHVETHNEKTDKQYCSKSLLSTDGQLLIDGQSMETSYSYSVADSERARTCSREEAQLNGGPKLYKKNPRTPVTPSTPVTPPGSPDQPSEEKLLDRLLVDGHRASLSTSQPHLPSASQVRASQVLPRASSHSNFYQGYMCIAVNNASRTSVFQTKFPDNSRSATSLNSMLSKTCGSAIFSDDPDMLEKYSLIEQEMDDCLTDNAIVPCAVHTDPLDRVLLQNRICDHLQVDGNGDCLQDSPGSSDSSVAPMLTQDTPRINIRVSSSVSSLESEEDHMQVGSSGDELSTINLTPNGECYLYRLKSEYAKSCLSPSNHPPRRVSFSKPPTPSSSSEDIVTYTAAPISSVAIKKRSLRLKLRDAFHQNKKRNSHRWRALLNAANDRQQRSNKHRFSTAKRMSVTSVLLRTHKNYISRRTASNEKKASKVLGIIFAVFVLLWTPFFIVNIVSVVCQPCMVALTPAMMAAIVWLGYLSSLANPIIYTMFNTAFRRAFYKILLCRYPHQLASKSDTFHITSPSGWATTRRSRSNTLQFDRSHITN